MNNDKTIKTISAEIKEGHFVNEKTGEAVKYNYLYIPVIKKRVKIKLEPLEKDVLKID